MRSLVLRPIGKQGPDDSIAEYGSSVHKCVQIRKQAVSMLQDVSRHRGEFLAPDCRILLDIVVAIVISRIFDDLNKGGVFFYLE